MDQWDDYLWLVSADAASWLERVESSSSSLVQLTARLRRDLSPARTHLLLELRELRRRAAEKFSEAHRLFFTPRGLEQSTDQWIANYKAQRFARPGPIVDLCCGIGGDLFALGQHAPTTGIDLDRVHALLAQANCNALGLDPSVEVTDATRVDLTDFAAWHIDPDRRPEGHRTTSLEFSLPPLDAIQHMLQLQPHAALKVAPATQLPAEWESQYERQWIGSGRECRQQVVWCGHLALHPGRHTALVAGPPPHQSELLVGTPDQPVDIAPMIDDYVYEPHATVLAAHLDGALAHKHDLMAITVNLAYFTSARHVSDPLLSGFQVLDVLPFDSRRLRSALQHYDVGHLEVKKRGVDVDPEAVRREMRRKGTRQATVLIAPYAESVHAIVCQRLEE